MKNFVKKIGMIAFVAVLGLGLFTSCTDSEPTLTVNATGEKTTVTITGIPDTYNNKWATGGLADAGNDDMYVFLPMTKIADGKVTLDVRNDKAVTISVEGDGYIVLLIYETDNVPSKKEVEADPSLGPLYEGLTYPEPVKAGANTVPFDKFTSTKK